MKSINLDKAIENFCTGKFVIIMDDEERENEGDLVIAAEDITPEKVAFLLRYTSGIICVPLLKEKADLLGLFPMVKDNTDSKQTNFTISCDHVNVSTGISAKDRSVTIKNIANLNNKSEFTKPGHIFPLISHSNGLKSRQGHTEAAIEMCQLTNKSPVAVISELMLDNGEVMRLPDCKKFSRIHNIPIITIKDLLLHQNHISYDFPSSANKTCFNLIKKQAETDLFVNITNIPIKVKCLIYKSKFRDHLYTVIIYGDIKDKTVPVRVHSECFTGNILHSLHCDCYQQFKKAFNIIVDKGYGIVIYCGGHEGRGIGLIEKIKAYNLQLTNNLDTIEANIKLNHPIDDRNYDTIIHILSDLNIKNIDLITNNPDKVSFFKEIINNIIDISIKSNKYNKKYLETKCLKMNHSINLEF